MKTGHEGRWRRLSPELNDRGATLLRGRSVHSVNQRGGITADTVNITVHQAAHPNSAISERFEALKRRVLHVGIRNKLTVELHALREFLVESNLLQRPAFRDFFEKWLTKMPVVVGWAVLNAFTSEEVESLSQELIALRVRREDHADDFRFQGRLA